jgi:uncharacterized membrane protein (DUF373 family)
MHVYKPLDLSRKVIGWQFVVIIDFLCYILPFVLFKILIQICKIISYISTFFRNKTNHNKIYDFYNFLIRQWSNVSKKVNSDNN